MNSFKQRSSLASAFLTGLIGWIGWMFIGPLMFGFTFPAKDLLLISLVSTLVQVGFLKLLFFPLRMQRSLFVGAFWGLVTAVGLYFATAMLCPEMKEHTFSWLLIYAYIGAPVGGFLSYFYIDDKKIFDEQGTNTTNANYGRDAHWMEPFGYGVIAYLIAFLPFNSFDLFVNVFIVGAISGVAAAGASHFSPDKWKQSFVLLGVIILVVGGLQGAISGLLFRNYTELLRTNHIVHGAIGGVITYLITFIRGRYLAHKEMAGEL